MPTNISTLTHLVCDILSRLVALDEGDGLLNFQTFFRPVATKYEGTNGPLIIAIVLSGGILEFLVRHTIIRVLGTCLVISCLENDRLNTTAGDSEAEACSKKAIASTSVFSLLRRTKLLRSRLRRSISYALMYSLASALCNSLASSLSTSHLGLASAEMSTVVLLERIHLRWTLSVTSRTPRALSHDWRSLLLPAMFYAIAQKIVAEVPELVGAQFVAVGSVFAANAVATRDIVVLASAFTLRFFVLYPAWAGSIAFETQQIWQWQAPTPDLTGQQQQQERYAYGRVLRLCYQKVLLRLASLHLQAAGLMIGIEIGLYAILHFFLLHTPTGTTLSQQI